MLELNSTKRKQETVRRIVIRLFLVLSGILSISSNVTAVVSSDGRSTGVELVDNGEWVYGDTQGSQLTVFGCSGSCPRKLVIPDRIDGKKVTAIGDLAFKSVVLESVELPETLISIGWSAFENSELDRIQFPASLERIGESACAQNRFKALTLGESVVEIGRDAFKNQKSRLP